MNNEITTMGGQTHGQSGSAGISGQAQATNTSNCGEGSAMVTTMVSECPCLLGAVAGKQQCRQSKPKRDRQTL